MNGKLIKNFITINFDRMSLLYGHPFMIDVQDCDARLSSSGDPNDQYTDEFVRLSIILGRVLKTIYTSVLNLIFDLLLTLMVSVRRDSIRPPTKCYTSCLEI